MWLSNLLPVVSSGHFPHSQMQVGVAMGGRGSPSLAVISPKGLLRFEQLSSQERDKLEEERDLPVYRPKRDRPFPHEDPVLLPQTFRPKERMRTNSVALVMCLNIGVDPPDVVKINPCARMECWIDPIGTMAKTPSSKVLDQIGQALQKQYEKWQTRARYKQALDPTFDDIKKLCTSLRKSAKDERVLFHYNGHGVPKPTHNGEIWVFNKQYTQYIPLSLYDLHQWMGSPSIYVYDCSAAGILLSKLQTWTTESPRLDQHPAHVPSNIQNGQGCSATFENCIQLAACREDETLPMDPSLPADMFTACLTTPIKMALKCYVLNNSFKLVPDLTPEDVENVPGMLIDRRTMLGELNWIFTAITDTIAWNVLPKTLFQKLFRQDLLVASLFRNFLLAERVMRVYDCNPQSSPALPKTFQHPMWQAWDLALDSCLRQLPDMLKNKTPFSHSQFFADQLTAFEVWLRFSSLDVQPSPPEQLPIVLQVLLSQVHRTRALELLGKFLDLGPWAVSQALSVGIFPYILKLLQSQARELRPLLVFIWAKILAVDCTYQVDLVRENSHKYFLDSLQDNTLPMKYRTMAAFILSCLCADGHHKGQKVCMQRHVVAACTELLSDSLPESLKKWLCILLGRLWDGYCEAKWLGIRSLTHERLIPLLQDPSAEVRAAAVYALGTMLNSQTERTPHADTTDSHIGKILVTNTQWDASPLVRQELVVALQWLLCVFDTQYMTAAYQTLQDERRIGDTAPDTPNRPAAIKQARVKSASNFFVPNIVDGVRTPANLAINTAIIATEQTRMRRISSGNSLPSQSSGGVVLQNTVHSQHSTTWKFLNSLATVDPHENVCDMTNTLVRMYRNKAESMIGLRRPSRDHLRTNPSTTITNSTNTSHSEPSSPSGTNSFLASARVEVDRALSTGLSRSSSMYHGVRMSDSLRSLSPAFSQSKVVRPRRNFDNALPLVNENRPTIATPDPSVTHTNGEVQDTSFQLVANPVVRTNFLNILTCQVQRPSLSDNPEEPEDRDALTYSKAEFRYMRNATVRRQAAQALRSESYRGLAKVEEQQFSKRLSSPPSSVVFHPFEPLLFVSDSQQVVVFDTERMVELDVLDKQSMRCSNRSLVKSSPRISSTVLVNAHHDRCLLLTATTDGAIRAWANTYSSFYNPRKPDPVELVTAFNCILDAPEIQTSLKCSGVLLDWDQSNCQLITCGDMRVVRLWDMNQERRILDMPIDADDSVRCISLDKNVGGSLLAVGMRDGAVKLYDRRRPTKNCKSIMSFRVHYGQVVGVHLDVTSQTLTSASVAGDVRSRILALSSNHSNNLEERVTQLSQQDLTCMAVHPYFPGAIACGTQGQNIVILEDGAAPQVVKPHQDWFSGQRLAPVNALAFHPFKMSLAAASQDLTVSLYQRRKP